MLIIHGLKRKLGGFESLSIYISTYINVSNLWKEMFETYEKPWQTPFHCISISSFSHKQFWRAISNQNWSHCQPISAIYLFLLLLMEEQSKHSNCCLYSTCCATCRSLSSEILAQVSGSQQNLSYRIIKFWIKEKLHYLAANIKGRGRKYAKHYQKNTPFNISSEVFEGFVPHLNRSFKTDITLKISTRTKKNTCRKKIFEDFWHLETVFNYPRNLFTRTCTHTYIPSHFLIFL